MKRNLFIGAIVACFACIILSSYEHGPAYEGSINRTGSQGGAANCAGSGCHDANSPTTVVNVTVYNSAGIAVTQYAPGSTYTVAITGHNTSTMTFTEYGFQVSAVLGSSTQAGSFAVPSGSDLRVTTLAGLQIVEHKNALDDSITNYFVSRFSWTAPAAGSGDVQFYGILNPFGGDGSSSGDDGDDDGRRKGVRYRLDDDDEGSTGGGDTTCPNISPVLTLTEGSGSSSAVTNVNTANSVSFYPNPCSNVLNINTGLLQQETYTVTIYAMNGTKVYSETSEQKEMSINTVAMAPGLYSIEIVQNNLRVVKTIAKQ